MIVETIPEIAGSQVGPKEEASTFSAMVMFLRAIGAWPVAQSTTARFRSSLPLLATFRRGLERSPSGQSLNPQFCEWLMGWTIGWTDAGAPVTVWSRWLRHSRTALSRLTLD